MQYTNGDIALMLTDDFAGCNLSASHTGEDLSRAHRLLIAAAALRPALVAPDTGAWSVLRALPAEPDLPGLHACVRLIADYGERHPPLGPHMFAPDPPPSL